MKNKFWLFVIILLIISPTVVAFVSYFSTDGSPVNQNSVSSLKLTDLYNDEYSFEKTSDKLSLDNIGSNMVQFFTDINTGAKSEPELPEPLRGTKYYKVVLNNYGREVEYKYYFSKQPEYCYYLDEKGKCFSINREYAVAFLNSVYGRSVFNHATLPIMTTPAGEIIEPVNIKWTYLAADDVSPTYTEDHDASDTVFNIAEQIAVAFSIPAGSANITITDAEGELYNGLYENISYTNIPTGVELNVNIVAKWYQTEERLSEGEATYSFKCRVTDKPVFNLDQNFETIIPGDFVNITGKNVISPTSDISVTTLPDLKVTPVFYTDGYYVRALVPVPLGTPAGNYTVKIIADGTEHNLDFTVDAKTYHTKYESIDSSLLSDENFAAFDEAMKSVLTAKSEERYFDGEFIYPLSNGYVSSGFGMPTQTSSGYKYTSNWVRVGSYSSSDDILAMNAGKVVYVGEQTITGKTVVVDHGLGLMSIYGNMETVSVNVGDVVTTGDVLGVLGNSGYTDGNLVSVTMNINGTYVCPYEIWDKEGVIFTEIGQTVEADTDEEETETDA